MNWFIYSLDYITSDKGRQQRWFICPELALGYLTRLYGKTDVLAAAIINEETETVLLNY